MAIAGAGTRFAEAKIVDAVAVFDVVHAVAISDVDEDSVTLALAPDLQVTVSMCSVPVRSELRDQRIPSRLDHEVVGVETPPFRSMAGLGYVSVGTWEHVSSESYGGSTTRGHPCQKWISPSSQKMKADGIPSSVRGAGIASTDLSKKESYRGSWPLQLRAFPISPEKITEKIIALMPNLQFLLGRQIQVGSFYRFSRYPNHGFRIPVFTRCRRQRR